MLKSTIKEMLTKAKADQKVEVYAWVRSKRESKACAFLAMGDGSMQGTLQCVVDRELACFEKLSGVQTGACLKVSGHIKESPAKGQNWEVAADSFEILGECPTDYPLQKKGHTLEFLREISHLRSRTNTHNAVFRIRNTVAQEIHKFFSEQGFIWVHTPILTSSDAEGAGEMFRVTTFPVKTEGLKYDPKRDFFGGESFLTVSGQLQGEAFAHSHTRIYTFGPTFRAENSNTSRHLSEFWMVEPEVAFADLDDIKELAFALLQHVFKAVGMQHAEELQFFKKFYKGKSAEELLALASAKLETVSYSDAVDLLAKSGKKFEFAPKWGNDLQTEHERYLCEEVFKGPIAVTDYPADIKAFYMRMNEDQKTVAAMDVLVPGVGEIIGGSQREERLPMLLDRMQAMSVSPEHLRWYLDLRKFGTCPHGGFGLGFERIVQYVTSMANIRDVIPFPRTPGSIKY